MIAAQARRRAKGKFPAPVRVSPRCVAWPQEAVDAWMAEHGGRAACALYAVLDENTLLAGRGDAIAMGAGCVGEPNPAMAGNGDLGPKRTLHCGRLDWSN